MPRSIIVENIGEVLSLRGASQKRGRRVASEDLSPIRRAALVVENGRVAWLGPQAKMPKAFWREKKAATLRIFDAQGRTLLPAFVECHTHLIFSGDRRDEFELRNQGASYQEIAERGGGIASTVKQTKQASEEALLALAQTRVDGFIGQGVTTVEVKSGYGLSLQSEVRMLQVASRLKRARICPTYLGPHSIPPGFQAEDYLQQILEHDLPYVAKNQLAKRADIFVEKGYFTQDQGARYLAKAKELGLGLTIHADQLTRSGGAELALSYAAQSADHLIQINSADIQALANSEVTAVLLPGADFYLKMPYPPARALLEAGARVAVATDFNPGSCPSQSLSLMGVLARRYMGMTLPEVIVAYTWNAAAALGLEQELGSLEIGKAADFQVLEGDWRELFYEVGREPAVSVWREGRKLAGAPLRQK